MLFLARLFARFSAITVTSSREPFTFATALPGRNLVQSAHVTTNLLPHVRAVRHEAPRFPPPFLVTFRPTATVQVVPLSRFGDRFKVLHEAAARLRPPALKIDHQELREGGTAESFPLSTDELFFRELDRHPQLSVEETNRLLDELASLGPLRETNVGGRRVRHERMILPDRRSDYIRLRSRLLLGHLRLCLHIVRSGRWPQRCNSMTEQDLFQEALLGLARAIELFKPERHTALSTYAFQWIRHILDLNQRVTQIVSFAIRSYTMPARTRTECR